MSRFMNPVRAWNLAIAVLGLSLVAFVPSVYAVAAGWHRTPADVVACVSAAFIIGSGAVLVLAARRLAPAGRRQP